MPKTATPLTATEIKNAKSKKSLYKLQDGGGLSLWIYPSGNRVWHLRMVNEHGKREEISQPFIGTTLAEARAWREQMREKRNREGTILEKPKQSVLFVDVFNQWFEKWAKGVTERHAKQLYAKVTDNAMPTLGNMEVSEIMPRHIILSLQGMEERGALSNLDRTLTGIRQALDYAVARGVVDMNAARSVTSDAFEKAEKTHFRALPPEKLPELITMIERAKADGRIKDRTYYLIYWQLLTMTRPEEAAGAQWEEIDDKARLWTIPAERMKKRRDHLIPLSAPLMEILKELEAINVRGVYLFESDKLASIDHTSRESVRLAFRRLGIDSTAHGLRALARTYLEETGKFRHEALELCLAHVNGNTTERAYNRAKYLDERREILDYWASVIQGLK